MNKYLLLLPLLLLSLAASAQIKIWEGTSCRARQVTLTEFLPDYQKFGRSAPLKRNLQIIAYADLVLAFWDGQSHGTKYVIDHCRKQNVPVRVILL